MIRAALLQCRRESCGERYKTPVLRCVLWIACLQAGKANPGGAHSVRMTQVADDPS